MTLSKDDPDDGAETQRLINVDAPLNKDDLQRLLRAFATHVRAETHAGQLLALTGNFSDLQQIQGEDATYWYSSHLMTDTYARWAMLAQEDDAARALIECTREESKVYPRPLCAKSLANAPFNLSEETLEEAFARIQKSGEYTDIERLEASNGDIYYFSSKYLVRARAQALAQYYSVDMYYNV
jgi:hypothetical protein